MISGDLIGIPAKSGLTSGSPFCLPCSYLQPHWGDTCQSTCRQLRGTLETDTEQVFYRELHAGLLLSQDSWGCRGHKTLNPKGNHLTSRRASKAPCGAETKHDDLRAAHCSLVSDSTCTSITRALEHFLAAASRKNLLASRQSRGHRRLVLPPYKVTGETCKILEKPVR